ncbi:16S rRNA (uracil(1498)-N(3))-methyltransferase [Lacisediminihabitans profunda]|uniref:Ribosomal RNA small subunit methyltransferase E n=1 Tax=Lacisediminihabitans profunda TaxID=2594790 RepID=A0A5C8UWU4_9MICO|nr:16S rRNA (uracil(1498)-N(3))-methyltransferase [Lacisediminihabitans profunda]TXN32852.1 16S rRNA (uracil(1498)-N(3))-methyltransferase [Lacisediminihabitans profunda]
MAHFYLNEELTEASVGGLVSVTGQEARHAVTVSRIAVGESISVGNGAGLVVSGAVVSAEPSEFVVEVASVERSEQNSPAVWLAQALAKGDRDEYAVQQATELGVDGVIPWAAQRSIVKWEGARIRKGHDRWTAIVREASKQSMRTWIPEVGDLASTVVLAALAADTRMLVLEPTAQTAITAIEPDGRDVVLVVGPEGGIAPSELSRLEGAGATLVRLGDTILRTSSAGPAAIAVLNARLGRW